VYCFSPCSRLHAPCFIPGGLAQLGERLHGMQEVSGSSPLSSTTQSLRPIRLDHQIIKPRPLVAAFLLSGWGNSQTIH
jgi:hypothetical protein